MARSLNQIMLVGNVGQDPEVRSIGNGQVANFSIATSREWTDRNDGNAKREKTEWHRCAAFGNAAEIISKYVKKGMQLTVVGRMEYSESPHKDHPEIKMKYATVVVDTFILPPRAGDGDAPAASTSSAPRPSSRPAPAATAGGNNGPSSKEDDDDLPF